jgi:predicted Rossmann-fold nucleotide-binding protein
MSPLKICVFGSSSSKTSQNFCDNSFLLGESIANKGLICINGGGMGGCMGGIHIFILWLLYYIFI